MQSFAPSAPRAFWLVLAPLLLAGCMLPPPQKPLAPALTAEQVGTTSLTASTAAPFVAPHIQWWRSWRDPQLDALMEQALADAPDVRMAAARLAAAQAGLGEVRAQRGVQSGVTAQGALGRESYNNGFPKAFIPKGYNDSGRVALELGYDVDLWGKNRAAVASARAEAQAAALDVAQSHLALSTALASAYAQLHLHDRQLVLARTWRDVRRQMQEIADARVAQGLANQSEALLARSETARALGDVARAEQARDEVRTRIAALAGLGPDRARAMRETRTPPAPSLGQNAQVPLDLLGRRPDILAARARLEATAARIKVARASYYPNVNIGAFIGMQALGLDRIFSADSQTGQIGPAISLPIFGSNTIRSRHRRAEADYEAARASYDSILLQALREAADTAQARTHVDVQLQALQDNFEAAQNMTALMRQRYSAGIVPRIAYLEAQSQMVQAERALVEIHTQSLLLDVALVRALGGGLASDTPS